MIQFPCPNCQAIHECSEQKSGVITNCRHCGWPIEIPDPVSEAVTAGVVVPKPTPRPPLVARPEKHSIQVNPPTDSGKHRAHLLLLGAGVAGLFAVAAVLLFVGFIAYQNHTRPTEAADVAGANKLRSEKAAHSGLNGAALDNKPMPSELSPFPPPNPILTPPVIPGKPPEEPITRDKIKALSDEDPKVRIKAIQEWGQLGAQGQAALPHLLKALSDPEISVGEEAAAALGKIAPPRPDDVQGVIPVLGKILASRTASADGRRYAARALGEAGRDGQPAIPALKNAVSDDVDNEVRCAAVDSLGKLGVFSKDAIPFLAGNLANRNDAIRVHALNALSALGPLAADAVPALDELISDKGIDKSFRMHVAVALAKINPKTTEKDLLPLYVDALAEPDLRKDAGSALIKIGKPAVPLLGEALYFELKESKDQNVVQTRLAMIEVLGEIGPDCRSSKRALDALLNLSKKDPSSQIREAARKALNQIQK
ncbi:MAG TPA: HEAT repeat domain-containing protein [Gemmataceae bacterium]|jgi:HEAT repeat protein